MLADLTLTQWLLAALGAFLVGIGKGGIPGVGNGTVAIYALIFPAKASVGILLPILIAADVVAVLVYRRHADWSHLWRIIPWTALGIVIGWLVMDWVNEDNFRVVIGGLLLLLTAVHFGRMGLEKLRKVQLEQAVPGGRGFAVFVGLLGGFATQIANAAGPITALYLLAVRLPKYAFIGTGAWFFLLMNCFKVPFMVDLGLINMQSLPTSCVFALVAICGALIAPKVVQYIPQRLFSSLVWTVVVLSALLLLTG